MSRRLSSEFARAAFGALLAFACAGKAFASALEDEAVPDSPPIIAPVAEPAPNATPPTVLRTLDGKPWSAFERAPSAEPEKSPAHPDTPAAIAEAQEANPSAGNAPAAPVLSLTGVPTETESPSLAATVTPAFTSKNSGLPPLATLEFNPAVVAHSQNAAATSIARSIEAAPIAPLSKRRAAADVAVTAVTPAQTYDSMLGQHLESTFRPLQVQALMAPTRTTSPSRAQEAETAPPTPEVVVAALEATPPASPHAASETVPSEEAKAAQPLPAQAVVDAPTTPASETSIPKPPAVTIASVAEAVPAEAPKATETPSVAVASAAPVSTPPPTTTPTSPAETAPAAVAPTEVAATAAPAKGSLSGAPAPAPSADPDAAPQLLQQAAYTGINPRVDWRDVISPADKNRLKNLLSTRAAAIKQAEAAIDNGDKDAVAAAPATSNLLYAKPIAAQDSDILGAYRCRITRLGGPYPQLTAYRFTTCEVTQWPDGSLVVEKTSGTSRFIGRLWREPDSSFVYLGTVMPDEGAPWAYDEKPEENQAGRLYRIGASRLRLELPKPNTGSALDIVEFVRLK